MAMAARAAMASKMAYQKEKERKMKKLFNANANAAGGHQVRGGARVRAPPLVYAWHHRRRCGQLSTHNVRRPYFFGLEGRRDAIKRISLGGDGSRRRMEW